MAGPALCQGRSDLCTVVLGGRWKGCWSPVSPPGSAQRALQDSFQLGFWV
jgi:hypothetical protein